MFQSARTWLSEIWAAITASPGAMAVAALSLMAGLGAGLVPEQRVFNYLWRDPTFCGSCHAHDYANEAYDHSVHAGLTTCHDCHLVPIRHYPRNLWMMVFDRPQGPEDITRPEIPTVVCTRCHSAEADDEPLTGPMPQELRERIVKVDDSPLHRVHLSSKTRTPTAAHGGRQGEAGSDVGIDASNLNIDRMSWDAGLISCTDCHGSDANRAHQFTATREACVACHQDTQLHGGSMASADCRQCHLSAFVGASAPQTGASAP